MVQHPRTPTDVEKVARNGWPKSSAAVRRSRRTKPAIRGTKISLLHARSELDLQVIPEFATVPLLRREVFTHLSSGCYPLNVVLTALHSQ
jgi:hypothetical protein